MFSARRGVPPVVVPVLVLVAIGGYLIGIHRTSGAPATASSASSAQETRIASGPSVLLEYPTGWEPASTPPAIPGLSIARPLLLAPGGDAARAGLISGQFPPGGSSPLPSAFLALVRGIPHTEVVTLDNLQAYSYSGLSGYDRTLDVYVIPTVGQSPTVLICYAANGYSSELQQCERIAAKVTLVGETSYDLSPNAAYATQLSGVLASLERERASVRRQMHAQQGTVGALASTLAARFATAAASVTALEPPQAAIAAQAALATALLGARDAYTALAGAATAEGPAGYPAAERRIDEAETGVNTALESFALLGYNHT